jgi:hypothetical protein
MLYIVIPTYWTGDKLRTPLKEDLIFDHPTPLDGQDTLRATLDSLCAVQSHTPFRVMIVTAAVHPELGGAAEAKVDSLLDPYRDKLAIAQFSYSALERSRRALADGGFDPASLSLEGYSAIRNCQLFAPALLEAGRIAAIDDDELVAPDFADRTGDFLGSEFEGKRVDGVAGRYYYEWGSFYVKEAEGDREAEGLFRKKQVYQNDSYKGFDALPGRLVPTTITLGGNMVFSPELYNNIPFDPLVTRGEDIDYLINSMLYGYNWMMDKELRIDHFPPPCRSKAKLQEDVIRFVYEREKLRLAAARPDLKTVTAGELEPYPGHFLKDDLDEESLQALAARRMEGDEEYYMSPEEVLAVGTERAAKASAYFDYVGKWRAMLPELRKNRELCAYLDGLFSS